MLWTVIKDCFMTVIIWVRTFFNSFWNTGSPLNPLMPVIFIGLGIIVIFSSIKIIRSIIGGF